MYEMMAGRSPFHLPTGEDEQNSEVKKTSSSYGYFIFIGYLI
jgi:hypothetical protein